MVKFKDISIDVIKQGSVVVHGARIITKGKNSITLQVLLHSKYCEYLGSTISDTGEVGIILGASEYTLQKHVEVDTTESTVFTFPTLCGWEIFAWSMHDTILNVCLIKN